MSGAQEDFTEKQQLRDKLSAEADEAEAAHQRAQKAEADAAQARQTNASPD